MAGLVRPRPGKLVHPGRSEPFGSNTLAPRMISLIPSLLRSATLGDLKAGLWLIVTGQPVAMSLCTRTHFVSVETNAGGPVKLARRRSVTCPSGTPARFQVPSGPTEVTGVPLVKMVVYGP